MSPDHVITLNIRDDNNHPGLLTTHHVGAITYDRSVKHIMVIWTVCICINFDYYNIQTDNKLYIHF